MEIHLDSADEGVVRLRLGGVVRESGVADDPFDELDVSHARSSRVLLDLADVKMLNSNGLGWLLTCNKQCREAGGRLVIHSVPAMAMNVVKMMRLDNVLTIVANEQKALELTGETQA